MPTTFNGLILIGGNLASLNGDYFALSIRSRFVEARSVKLIGCNEKLSCRYNIYLFVNDFQNLIIINAYKLVSFNLGKGRGIALSKVAVEVNQWYRATIERIEQNFTLKVNDEAPVMGRVPGSLTELNSLSDIYLGTLPSSLST